jgi:hypothetical protein
LALSRSVEAFHADEHAGETEPFHRISSCYFISHGISSLVDDDNDHTKHSWG